MGPLASKALTFSALVGLTVMLPGLFFTLSGGVFEQWAVKTILSQVATGLSVMGWSLIGAVPGMGLSLKLGRHISWSRTVLFGVLLGAFSSAAAIFVDRIFEIQWGLLFGYDGIAWIELTFVYFIVWWASSSFVTTIIVARRAPQPPPNKSFERTREG